MKQFLYISIFGALLLNACSMPSATLVPSISNPVPSATPSAVPSATSVPTPVPTPTLLPGARIETGDISLFEGNFTQANQEFQAALASTNDTKVKIAAIWGLAKTDFIMEGYSNSLDNLRILTQEYPNTPEGISGWFLLGETYFALNRYQESANAYQEYLSSRPGLIDQYVQVKRGDAFTSIGNYSEAMKSYSKALEADGQIDKISIQVKLANSELNMGDPGAALKIYDEIYGSTTNDYLKAQMDLLSGRALIALSRSDDGYGRWRHAVENYPLSFDSYSALVGLVDANQVVDEFNRGLVDYYAQKYDVALAAFQRYAVQNPNHDGTVLYYEALTLQAMGDYNSAISLWDLLIQKYPGNRYWASAWDERATTQWVYLNEYESAAKGLEEFAANSLGSSYASTYLFEAARIYERSGNLEKAAELWESLPGRFDSDPAMGNAWFQAGIARYRLENYPRANTDFQQSLLLAKEPTDRAKALLWIGKTYAVTRDSKNAISAWEQATAADSGNYYSLRANDLIENRVPFSDPPAIDREYNLAKERNEAASWVRIKFNLPAETDLTGIGSLQTDSRLMRGEEFWKLGLYDEARLEFESLRESLKTNPADSFRLGNYLIDIGAYRSGIYCLREVLNIAGLDDHAASLTAPIYFKHIRYGLYYSDLVWAAAEETKFNPLFLTSVIRQESLFEGFVHSTAGARGLMQILPTTGSSIATQLGWPVDFTPDDLYSPYISIKLGSNYLNSNRRLLSNDLYATLAAYNSGPGNASIWQGLAKGDPDLELEIIRYGETRDYIRGIYETYSVYRGLYTPVQ